MMKAIKKFEVIVLWMKGGVPKKMYIIQYLKVKNYPKRKLFSVLKDGNCG